MIRARIRWWLMVTAEDPVRRVLNQACAAIVTLCLLITIATLAALFLGGATTRGFFLIPAIPVWIIAWRINRRGSPFGAALMSYMLIPFTLILIDFQRYLTPWLAPIVVDAPLMFPIIAGLFSMGPRQGIYLTLVEILSVLAAGAWRSTDVDRLANFAIFGSLTILPIAGLLALITKLYLRAVQTASDAKKANQHLRAYLLQAEDLAIEQERVRVAREIHDGLGHHLNNAKLHAAVARRYFDTDRTVAIDSLATTHSEISHAQHELRRAIDALLSEMSARPLEELLQGPVRDCQLAGIAASLQVEGIPRALSEPISHALYRIGQEALNNIRQHSRAKQASIRIEYHDRCVRLIIEDDGIGLSTNLQHRRGHGLDNLQERAALVGGRTEIESRSEQGVRIVVEIPYE